MVRCFWPIFFADHSQTACETGPLLSGFGDWRDAGKSVTKVRYGMSINNPFQGSLFANDFLCESIVESPDWRAIDDMALDTLSSSR